MHIKHTLTVTGLAAFALLSGCSADADSGSDGAAEPVLKVAEKSTEQYEYAPEGVSFEAAKAEPVQGLSPKGSVSLTRGYTYMKAVSIPPEGIVGCYTASGSVGVDPVLVLFRRGDNQQAVASAVELTLIQASVKAPAQPYTGGDGGQASRHQDPDVGGRSRQQQPGHCLDCVANCEEQTRRSRIDFLAEAERQ